ncbi:Der GTPase-activating protein, putative [Babesia ovata]|uniref:Der GTPase-activating protein, putative n=1 Tax=Babesia ovata TaxID=189622 RepID=A0A2H6KJB7_9APIC|nr:Der GTPase-activating protein, putative [Babesia ovata]GBE63093.1 Der GTPase-activating protein, putative [Babesia ovata]
MATGYRTTHANSGGGGRPTKGLAFYANSVVCYSKLERSEDIYLRSTKAYHDLTRIFLEIPRSNATAKTKEADKKKCLKLMTEVQRISTETRQYPEVRQMINLYRVVARDLQKKYLTPKLVAKLHKTMAYLEDKFKGKERLSCGLPAFGDLEYDFEVAYAEEFINQPRFQELLPPTPSGQASAAGPGGNAEAYEAYDVNAVADNMDVPDYGTLLDDTVERSKVKDYRFLSIMLHEVHEMAENMAIMLRDLSTDIERSSYAGSSASTNKTLADAVRRWYDKYGGDLVEVTNAWDVYKSYNDTTDVMGKLDLPWPQSGKVGQQSLQSELEQYAPPVSRDVSRTAEQHNPKMLHTLQSIEQILNRFTSQRRADSALTLPPTKRSETTTRTAVDTAEGNTPDGVSAYSNVRYTKDGNKSSGLVTMGISVIQTIIAVGIMAAL